MWRVERGALESSTVEALRREADELSEREAPCWENGCVLEPVSAEGGRSWRVDEAAYGEARAVAPTAAVTEALFVRLAELAAEFLGRDVVVFNEHYVVKPAHSEIEFRWHRDGDEQLASASYDAEYVSCWCALDVATDKTGCLVVQDGSLECEVGDVVLLSSKCAHRSGPNKGDVPRRAYYAQYTTEPVTVGGHVLRLAIPCRGRYTTEPVTVGGHVLRLAIPCRRPKRRRVEPRFELDHLPAEVADAARAALENQHPDAWEAVRELCWAILHGSSDWRSAPVSCRRAYAVASYHRARSLSSTADKMRVLDLGLMIDDGTHRAALLGAVARLEDVFDGREDTPTPLPRVIGSRRPLTGTPVAVLVEPSISTFKIACFDPRAPAKLEGAAENWPALQKWTDLAYLKRVAGHRLVPVELGDHYLDANFTEKLMPFSEFLDRYLGGQGTAGYLAQHALFDQIPALRRDVAIPDYCAVADDPDVEPRLNAWFGPHNTKSPLHHDRYHNLLCQVVGSKYVRLYESRHTHRLYPIQDGHHKGVSSSVLDIDAPHLDRDFPLFRDTPYTDCYLEPGDALYIPPHTWHYIEACETSFSVSAWWL